MTGEGTCDIGQAILVADSPSPVAAGEGAQDAWGLLRGSGGYPGRGGYHRISGDPTVNDRDLRLHPARDDRPFRVAVAGIGSFTQRVLLPGLLATPGVEVAGICGRTRERASETAARLGVGGAFDDYAAMLDASRPDAVVVATPNDVHAPMVLEAVHRGLHVLCEKPLGTSLAEAEAMERAARGAGVRTAMNFTYRSTTPFRHAWALIQAGAVGHVRHVTVTFHQGVRADPSAPISFRNLRERGGGALLDVGPHMVDALRWLVGEVEAVVGAAQTCITERPAITGGTAVAHVTADDVVSVVVRMRGGATGTVQLSQVTHGRHGYRRIEIAGEAGTLSLEEDRGEPAVVRLAPAGSTAGRLDPVPVPPELDVPFEDFPASHVGRIVRALRGQAPAPGDDRWPGFADGLAAQRVLDGVERSVITGRWVTLNDGIPQG